MHVFRLAKQSQNGSYMKNSPRSMIVLSEASWFASVGENKGTDVYGFAHGSAAIPGFWQPMMLLCAVCSQQCVYLADQGTELEEEFLCRIAQQPYGTTT